jgi:succinate dehydrogenase / fumarate reductase, cytochrome b subunit
VSHSVAAAPDQSFLDKNYFLIRRLHSLTGIVPIGVFLIAHLVTNSSAAWGAFALREQLPGVNATADKGLAYFWKEVMWINTQIPHLLLIEITLWASIAFHSVFGVYFALSGKSNTNRYSYQSNWRYSLQRISGYIGILFIFYHVATLRWGWTFLVPGGTKWSAEFAGSTLAAAIQGSENGYTLGGVLVTLLYFLGVTMLVYHFANGLWTAAITWGITISAAAQRRWGYVCAGLGVALMLMGWVSILVFAVVNPGLTRELEEGLQKGHSSLVEPSGNERLANAGRRDDEVVVGGMNLNSNRTSKE